MDKLQPGGWRCISIKPDECIRSLRIRNTIKTEDGMSLNEDVLIHHNSSAEQHEAFTQKQHEDAVGKCYENGKATQFNSNSCGAQDKSDNIGRFCSGHHGNVPFEIAISEFKKKEYKSQKTKVFLWSGKESGSFSTAEIRWTMLSAPGLAPDGFNRSAGSLSAGLTRRSVHVKNQDADKTQRSSGQ